MTDENSNAKSVTDYLAIALTTFGVGYIPLAPGTWGSAVGVLLFLATRAAESALGWIGPAGQHSPWLFPVNSAIFAAFCLLGITAATRSEKFFGRKDPSQAVVDEVQGQIITFFFLPFNLSWKFILTAFVLFRLFDIWKPYPIRSLEILPGGLGVCADDIVAGVYAGVVATIIYAVSLRF
jgi:phosphatidylglycerophosphatase A